MRARHHRPAIASVRKTILPLLFLMGAGAALAADQPIFANSDASPGPVDPGYNSLPWMGAADRLALAQRSPIDRWETQANAGRAKAATIVGQLWLERVPENPGNCAKASEWFTKADKLGSNEAPAWLGHLYRRFDCPQRDVGTATTWLRKAVTLMSFGAAADLSAIYGDTTAPEHDATLAYAYGRVAAELNEYPADDPASPGRLAALEQGLDAKQKKTATELADKLLAAVKQRRASLTAAPRAQKLKASASGSGWSVGLLAFDDLRECAANTAGNCKGVRYSVYFDAANAGDEYLRCKLAVDHREFALDQKATAERETLLPPRASRRLFAGSLGEIAGSQDLRVSCTPVPGLVAKVAADQCRVVTTGVPSVSDFYPAGSRQRNEEGRVTLNVWMDQKEGHPALVELRQSSGFPELDAAGVKMGSYMAFKGECDQGYAAVAVAFRLAE
jgi:TonB family protein